MAKITAPTPGLTANVVGVSFVDSVGETDSESLISYFTRHGYKVEGVKESGQANAAGEPLPDGKPSKSWKATELTAYAQKFGIRLEGATKKDDVWAAIEKSLAAVLEPETLNPEPPAIGNEGDPHRITAPVDQTDEPNVPEQGK